MFVYTTIRDVELGERVERESNLQSGENSVEEKR